MHSALTLLEFWALAFLTLCLTLVLLAVYWNLIEQDLVLHSAAKEASIAVAGSLVEALGVWLVARYCPQNGLALLAPAVVLAILYKISHLEDWHRYEIVCLLMFQMVIAASGANLLLGHFKTAAAILGTFVLVLGFIASFLRNW